MKAAQSGIQAFKKASAKGWDEGISLDELLARVNRVAAKLLPSEEAGDSRISPVLLPRTFRHYVTLGCIDPGHREGRLVAYGFRHFLQALLLRRLLAERVPARRMPELTTGVSNGELERMLIGGVEIVARPDGVGETEARPNPYQEVLRANSENSVSGWTRVALGEGIEIHLGDKRRRMTSEQRKRLLKRIEELVKRI